jgi:hypothetical protein
VALNGDGRVDAVENSAFFSAVSILCAEAYAELYASLWIFQEPLTAAVSKQQPLLQSAPPRTRRRAWVCCHRTAAVNHAHRAHGSATVRMRKRRAQARFPASYGARAEGACPATSPCNPPLSTVRCAAGGWLKSGERRPSQTARQTPWDAPCKCMCQENRAGMRTCAAGMLAVL